MEHAFWHERWTSNRIGFHRPSFNPGLIRYWPQLGLAAGSRVVVPLCGKSLDMLWLRDQGFRVAGIELSPLAVEAFFSENNLHPAVRMADHYDSWTVDGIELLCGDFFRLGQAELGRIDACYDRAALVALPEQLRSAYVRHLLELLPAGASGLLITLVYEQSEMEGPPFSVQDSEVEQLFAAHCALEQLHSYDALADDPGLSGRGLTALRETLWRVQRR